MDMPTFVFNPGPYPVAIRVFQSLDVALVATK